MTGRRTADHQCRPGADWDTADHPIAADGRFRLTGTDLYVGLARQPAMP